ESTIGIFIREFNVYSQILTLSGAWVHINSRRSIPFSIPGFVNPAMLDDVIPFLPKDETAREFKEQAHITDVSVPREVSAPLVTKLRQVWSESEAIYRANAGALDNAHQVLAHQTDLRFGTLEKIASKLLGPRVELTPPALLAVRRAILRQGLVFGADRRSSRFTRVFLIHPQQTVQSLHDVAGWIRAYQNAEASSASREEPPPKAKDFDYDDRVGVRNIRHFLSRAKYFIQHSRRNRPLSPVGTIGASRIQHPISNESESIRVEPSLPFSQADQEIIRFLFTACLTHMFDKDPRYFALAEHVIRSSGEYEASGELGRSYVYTFLQEIGAILPWENIRLHDEHLLLPNSQRSKPLERLRDSINHDDPTATFPDTMQDLRRDWKNLPVYCIDGPATVNVDDGISVERIPGSQDQYWIHIHVANPTARIDKSSNIARMAAHMTSTLYTPDDHYWLLPQWITQRFASLAPDRPVLTFSCRIDRKGNILQTTIQPGIVRNVTRLTYTGMDTILGTNKSTVPRNVLAVGLDPEIIEQMTKDKVPPNLTPGQREDLGILVHLAKARRDYRRGNGGFNFDFVDTAAVAISKLQKGGKNIAAKIPLLSGKSYRVEGDPGILLLGDEYSGYFKPKQDMPSRDMVTEMMLLAGEIGAQWCSERNIPVIYRGMFASVLRRAGAGVTTDTYWNEVLEPELKANGQVPDHLATMYLNLTGRVGSALVPLRHTGVGLPQYTKVTTPLGRYSDMVAHWQIESAIREEARTGESLKGSKREDYLAFTRSELFPVVPRLRAREQMLNDAKAGSNTFWINQLVYRAFYYKQAELPETFEVVVSSDIGRAPNVVRAIWKHYGIRAHLMLPPEKFVNKSKTEMFARIGDHWEARIKEVHPFYGHIYLEPVRLLHREEHTIDEIFARLGKSA
ncbi:RNB-domain-containing protein, partial [Rhizodiscina lignyota]